jgi:hypothetical protein
MSSRMRARVRFEVIGLPLPHNFVVDQSRDDVTHSVKITLGSSKSFFAPGVIQNGSTLLLLDNFLFEWYKQVYIRQIST